MNRMASEKVIGSMNFPIEDMKRAIAVVNTWPKWKRDYIDSISDSPASGVYEAKFRGKDDL